MSRKTLFSAILLFLASIERAAPSKRPTRPALSEKELSDFFRVTSLELERAAKAVGNNSFKSQDTLAAERKAKAEPPKREMTNLVTDERAISGAPAALQAMTTHKSKPEPSEPPKTKTLSFQPNDPADVNYDDLDTETLTAALGHWLKGDREKMQETLHKARACLDARDAAETAKMVSILLAMPPYKTKFELN